jgi:hypothetical protein
MFTGTGTVLFKNTGTCGGSRDSHGTNIVHTAERDTPITRVRARLGRACMARAAADVRLIARGTHCTG